MNETDYLKLVVEETPDAMIATDSAGIILYWSPGAETTFGYASAEALGKSLDDLVVPPADTAEQRVRWVEAREKGRVIYESVRRRKDGTLIYVNTAMHAVLGDDGAVRYFVSNKRDITEQKARRDASMLDARYLELLEWTSDAVVVVNSTGRIVLFNKQAETMFGYTAQEILGAPLEELMPVRFRGGHVGHRTEFFAHPRTRPMGIGMELAGLRKDGQEFPVEISLNPLHTQAGQLVVGSIRDVTERKHFEKSLQEASMMKSRFLASMSHELRTPLNGIIGFTEFLVDEKPGPLNPKQKEYLLDVYNSAQHLLQLINDVLDLAKVEAGRIEILPEAFSVERSLKEVRAVINGIARKKGIEVAVSCAPTVGDVILDQQKFKQICFNLLANAVKFTDPGGKVEVRILDGQPGYFQMQFEDTGIGIRQDDMKRLFKEFEQLDSDSTRRFEGTGLGLALTKRLVEYQGGTIEAQSEYGRGTTFIIMLPREYKKGSEE